MKKEIIITIIIVLVIFIANYFTHNYTKKCVREVNENLQEIKQEALNDENDGKELAERVNGIYEKWLRMSDKLSYYLEHNELEKVHSSLRTAKAHFEANEVEEGVPELENCMYILYHIEEKESFKLKNIF